MASLAGVMEADHPWPEPLRRMPDGTVKQINPYSGTSVWTVRIGEFARLTGVSVAQLRRYEGGRSPLTDRS